MFSTVLKEISSYFSKSFLMSVFFPSLFFWMLNLALGVLAVGVDDVVEWWSKLDGQVQGFLTAAFLIWVLFMAYVLHILLDALSQFYEGHWTFLKFIPEAMQKRNEKRWKALRARSEEMAGQLRALKTRQQALEQILDRDLPPLPPGTRVDVPALAQEAAMLYDQVRDWTVEDYLDDAKWNKMEEQLGSVQTRIVALSEDDLERHKALIGPGSKADLLFRQPYELLHDLVAQLEQDQLDFDHERLAIFPARLSWVMPTRVANRLQTARTYSFLRYNLDAVIIWPRLRETFPEKFASRLGDAKTNMDLMLVLTTLALVFGIAWGGIFVAVPDASLAVHKWIAAPAAFLAGVVIARLAYLSAAQGALSYGELFKTAFDLYRWEVLKALHLELPADLEGEKKLWGKIGDFLYRNYPFETSWKHS